MKKQSIILAGLLLLAIVLAGCTLGGQGGGPTGTTPQTHLECKNSQCARVPGAGLDQCRTNADCNVSHKECRNLACVSISGPGQNKCQSNADCNVTHLECRNLQCVSIQGQGQNLCQTNFDCNSHLACQGLSCIRIAGYGQDLCQSNADCNVSLAPDFNIPFMNRFHDSNGRGTLRFTVKNIGTLGYQGPLWHKGTLYKTDSNNQLVWIQTFNASYQNYYVGAQYDYNRTYSLSNGWYKFVAFADSNYTVNELRENNNENTLYFQINDSNSP